MCYKQKCKVVSLNLAHPVDYVDSAGRSSTGRLQPQYRRWKLQISSSTQKVYRKR